MSGGLLNCAYVLMDLEKSLDAFFDEGSNGDVLHHYDG